MRYEIEYALACDRGKVRSINQDNFYCPHKQFLDAANNGLDTIESHQIYSDGNPSFAVFDGMGGEQYGEKAAYIAAETLNSLQNKLRDKNNHKNIQDFLTNSCGQMNRNITDYAMQKLAACAGTTAAMMIFGEKGVFACNIGDSRIYRYRYNSGKLKQISQDHVADAYQVYQNQKPPLTRFLGMPESEYITTEPHITREPCNNGDCYLICSDGLTDMLAEDEIEKIIAMNGDVKLCVETLLENALLKGGRDNITIILCRINIIKKRHIVSGMLYNLLRKGQKYGIYG